VGCGAETGEGGEVGVRMKKAVARRGSSVAKRGGVPKDMDEYLARVPEPARSTLNKVRAAIRSAVPAEAAEAISYGIPTFKYKGNLVAFAAFSKHCSLFPMSYAVIDALKKDLEDFTVSNGTIRFPLDMALPAGLLKRMVKLRLAEKER
jgi:uncharacterized protein YdhG (YjbR/CyaY superfamily)